MTNEFDYHRNETLTEREERRDDRELQRKRAELYGVIDAQGCSYCANVSGMESWYWDDVAPDPDLAQLAWYKHERVTACIYSPCPVCNPGHEIPDQYLPLSWQEVLEWAPEQRQREAQREWRQRTEMDAIVSTYADSRDAAEAPAVQ